MMMTPTKAKTPDTKKPGEPALGIARLMAQIQAAMVVGPSQAWCRCSSITNPCGPDRYSPSGTRNRRRDDAEPSPPSVATQSTNPGRSFEEIGKRRVGKEWVRTGRSRGWRSHTKNKKPKHSN